MLFKAKWLSEIFTDYKSEIPEEMQIDIVTTDSRTKNNNTLFIPLVGDNFDGHAYIEQAISNGAIAVLWDKSKLLPKEIDAKIIVFYVEDTLVALQKLAGAYRDEINPVVIGITGSNGKTTTKDVAAAVLTTTYETHYTLGNFNNHIGLPLTILAMPRTTEMLIVEMGMNHFGEIEQLSKIAKPDYAIITNIGESHIEYLGSRAGIAKAKLEIITGMKSSGSLIIDGDEALLQKDQLAENTITCGFSSSNDLQINSCEIKTDGTIFELSNGFNYEVPLLGRHHAQNATYVIALAQLLQIEQSLIKQGLLELKQTAMRFEMIQGRNGVSIINDAYNASPTSMKAAIEVIKQMNGYNDKVLILGDIFELGEYVDPLHRSIADVIEQPITALLTYGDAAALITEEVTKKTPSVKAKHFTSKTALLAELEKHLHVDAILLFKASRGMAFEKIVENIY